MRARILVVLMLAGCGASRTGRDVELTVTTAATMVPDADLATITALDVTVSGAESDHKHYVLGRAMQRTERVLIHLSGDSGMINIGVLASDGQQLVVALGSTGLMAGGASAHQTTVALAAPPNGLHSSTVITATPATRVQLLTGQTVPLAADQQVTWKVMAGGVGGTVDDTGLYSAPMTAGSDMVVGTSSLYYGQTVTVTIDVLATGVVRYAGLTKGAGTLDGTGAAARIAYPHAFAFDSAGMLYFTDSGNVVRRLDPSTGTVVTIAGTAESNQFTDGTGSGAIFNVAVGLAYDGARNALYVGDWNTVRVLNLATNAVTTLAGTNGQWGSMDGVGAAARFESVQGLAYDGNGHLYAADPNAHVVRRIDITTANVTTLAGVANTSGYKDGAAATAKFNWPAALLLDGQGGLIVGDSHNQLLRRIDLASNMVSTLAGTLGSAGGAEGAPGKGTLSYPEHIAFDGQGTIWSAEGILRKIDLATGNVTNPRVGPMNNMMPIFGPLDAAGISPDGKLYIANNAGIDLVDTATFKRTTLAGQSIINPPDLDLASGSRWVTRFNDPASLCRAPDGTIVVRDGPSFRRLDPTNDTFTSLQQGNWVGGWQNCTVAADGTIYFIENNAILKLDATGGTPSVAGSVQSGGAVDGPATTARFNCPNDLVAVGNVLYVADTCNHTIRAVDLGASTVSTLAGTAGMCGYADMPGSAARFCGPQGITSDGNGNLFVVSNNAVRKIVIAGAVVSTLAGSDTSGFADGTGAAAKFNTPLRITFDNTKQNLYVSDLRNTAIRKVTLAGVVSTVAGQPRKPYLSTGALPGTINEPLALAFTPAGDLLVVVQHEQSIVQIRLP